MSQKHIREIFFYKRYFIEFYTSLTPDVQKKIDWTLQLIASVDRVPKTYFEHITNSSGLFEIRVAVGSDIYRIFSFFDKGRLLILVNAYQKKTQKTSKKEIELAEKLKSDYFHDTP